MKILALPGDGIGPEISQATLTALNRANSLYKLGLEWQRDEIGFTTLKKEGTTMAPRIMEAAMLLEWLGQRHKIPALVKAGANIDVAVDTAIKDLPTRTPDLGGEFGTQAFAQVVADKLA